MRKAHELRALLLDIYTAYNVEEHMSRILLRLVGSFSTELTKRYEKAIQRGSAICNEKCEICGKIIWGIGVDTAVFELWESGMRKSKKEMLNVKVSSIVVFMCGHGFHEQCLKNLGQGNGKYYCLICKTRVII